MEGYVAQRGWERFAVRQRQEGDYVLLMTKSEDLWPAGINAEQEVEYLARIYKGGSGGIIWDFIEVDRVVSIHLPMSPYP